VGGPAFERVEGTALLLVRSMGRAAWMHAPFLLEAETDDGGIERFSDPYCFGPQIGDFDRQVFAEGRHWSLPQFMGANRRVVEGVQGFLFAVWAPRAKNVSVVGDFNGWDGRCHPMQMSPGGIWELFIPGANEAALYKFEVRGARGLPVLKADPFGKSFQLAPETASRAIDEPTYDWQDSAWMQARSRHDWQRAPLCIYELHLGSWRKGPSREVLNYVQLAEQLIPYLLELGFTHVQLLPVTEHPYAPSWGYQALGYFAPTSRFGTPDQFRQFVDRCHGAGIGVLLDWVPAHFPKDAHGLARFDGAPLFEYEDTRRGEHPDWDTLVYDYGRPEVRNFLLASALYWMQSFHIDGLRVDAVTSMLHLDYSRKAGEWLPNQHGGRENLEAIEFLRELNHLVHTQHPGALVIAEESTSWPLVTRPSDVGGLGFSMKWNMGWMHDTLRYLAIDPAHRPFHQDLLTFGQTYAYSENFVLALSHDEVVHGKGSLWRKMAGDTWQRFAALRLLFAYQWTLPGKKLLFMGQEFAQIDEWNDATELDWPLLNRAPHRGIHRLIGDLNQLCIKMPELHAQDFSEQGFQWIDCHNTSQSVLVYLRRAGLKFVIVVLNFMPIPRSGYCIGVPQAGTYRELLNTDSAHYAGSNVGNVGALITEAQPYMGLPHSLTLMLPPLGCLVLSLD
jgi:glycogen branching enzyme (EC 2.4.1.18)